MEWISVEIEALPRDDGTYIVADMYGNVAPIVRGVIQNNVGTKWDWHGIDAVHKWMHMPPPPVRNDATQRPIA